MASVLSAIFLGTTFPHAGALGFKGKEESNLTLISCLSLLILSFSSGDYSSAVHDAHSVVQIGSSFDSADSYNGDDARCYHREWNTVIDRYSEATRENGRLEFSRDASQAALTAVEGKANAVCA